MKVEIDPPPYKILTPINIKIENGANKNLKVFIDNFGELPIQYRGEIAQVIFQLSGVGQYQLHVESADQKWVKSIEVQDYKFASFTQEMFLFLPLCILFLGVIVWGTKKVMKN